MKALIEGEYYTLAPGGKPQVIKTIMQRLKLADPSLAEEGHADVLKEFERKPYPSLDGLRNMQRLLAMQNPKLVDLNTANLMDTASCANSRKAVLSPSFRRAIASERE